MHVGTRVRIRWNAVDGADWFAIDQDDALVALAHILEVALHDVRLAEHLPEHFQQGSQVAVGFQQMENAGAAIAVKRLNDDVAMLTAEVGDLERILGDQRFRHQIRKFGDENLFRAVAHPCRIVDHQRLRMDALQDVGRRDVVHVERRVLAQQDHVHFRQISAHRLAQLEMPPLLVRELHRFHPRHHLAVAEREPVRRVVEQLMATLLRFQRQCETRVAGDLHGGHMIHLDGDLQGHRLELRKAGQEEGEALTGSRSPANPAQLPPPHIRMTR